MLTNDLRSIGLLKGHTISLGEVNVGCCLSQSGRRVGTTSYGVEYRWKNDMGIPQNSCHVVQIIPLYHTR